MGITRTHQYLLPMLTASNNQVIYNIKKILKPKGGIIRVGIWDTTKNYIPNSVYILMHVKRLPVGDFNTILKDIKLDKSYIDDYLYGNYLYDYLHMFVVKCPYDKAYHNFIHSKYSEMFSKEEGLKIYPTQKSKHVDYINKVRKIIVKDESLKTHLESSLDVIIPSSNELDSSLIWEDEIFNYYPGCEDLVLNHYV